MSIVFSSECGVGGAICKSCIGAPFTCNGGMCDGTSKSNDTPTLYAPSLSYWRGDAPKIEVVENRAIPWNGDFVQVVTRMTPLGTDRTDTRRTQFTMTWPITGSPVTGTIALQGQYLCQGSACPSNNMDPETRSCQATLPFVAVPLP